MTLDLEAQDREALYGDGLLRLGLLRAVLAALNPASPAAQATDGGGSIGPATPEVKP